MGFNSYEGSIKLMAGLTPSGEGYPLVQSCDIQVAENGTTLAEYIASGITEGVGISEIKKTSTNGLEDTYTITLTDGNTYTFTVTNGVQGGDGKPGEDGEDGYTPQKGVDYYTEADKAEMVEAVLNALPNGDVEEY